MHQPARRRRRRSVGAGAVAIHRLDRRRHDRDAVVATLPLEHGERRRFEARARAGLLLASDLDVEREHREVCAIGAAPAHDRVADVELVDRVRSPQPHARRVERWPELPVTHERHLQRCEAVRPRKAEAPLAAAIAREDGVGMAADLERAMPAGAPARGELAAGDGVRARPRLADRRRGGLADRERAGRPARRHCRLARDGIGLALVERGRDHRGPAAARDVGEVAVVRVGGGGDEQNSGDERSHAAATSKSRTSGQARGSA